MACYRRAFVDAGVKPARRTLGNGSRSTARTFNTVGTEVRLVHHDAARREKGERAPFRMVQLCLGQPLLHLGRGRDVSRKFFNLHNKEQRSVPFWLREDVTEKDEECAPHLVEPRADVGAHDKLDALDFGLYEHDPGVLRLGRVGVSA